MNKQIKPYIGVTGFASRDQIKALLDKNNDVPSVAGRMFMVGVCVTAHTLRGNRNRDHKKYPKIQDVESIFVGDPSCLNLIHFTSLLQSNILFDDLINATKFGGPFLNGFQLNIPWPEKEALEKYKAEYSNMNLVLQIGREAYKQKGNSLDVVYDSLREYEGVVDHISLNVSEILRYNSDVKSVARLVAKFSTLGQGIALCGDFNALNVQEELLMIVEKYPDISISAGEKLQAPNGGLNLSEVRKFLTASIPLFQGVKV